MSKARPRSAVTSRRKALKKRARSPMCRRTKRTIARSRKRSIFFAAPLRTRLSRRTRRLLFAKRRNCIEQKRPQLADARAETAACGHRAQPATSGKARSTIFEPASLRMGLLLSQLPRPRLVRRALRSRSIRAVTCTTPQPE